MTAEALQYALAHPYLHTLTALGNSGWMFPLAFLVIGLMVARVVTAVEVKS